MRPIVILAIASIAVITAAPPVHAEEWQKTYTVQGVPALTLDADDARVEVRGWDRNEVSVRIIAERSVGIGTGAEVRVSEEQNGDAVSLRVWRPHRRIRLVFQWRETTVEVRVPRRARLDLHTGDGSCEITAIEGDVAVETGDGSIRADDVSGHLHLRTSDGSIRGKHLGGELVAQTSDGMVEVYGTFTRLELGSSDGRILAEAAAGSSVGDAWDLHTGDGRITLRLPPGLAASVDARTEDGRVRVDTNSPSRGEASGRAARLDLNGGGGTIRLRSGDGSITVQQD